MWTWKQLNGSTSLDRVLIAELWAGFMVYLFRGVGNVAFLMLPVSLATLAWAALLKGFYWRNGDEEPAPTIAGRILLAAIGAVWLAWSIYLLRAMPEP